MKWKAVLILLSITLGIIAPPSLPLMIDHGVKAEIGTLDVCRSATPALSSNGDMPCMNECPCRHLPLAESKNAGIITPPFKPLLIAFQDERPPKV
jgi:hypothetical protein